MKRVDEYGSVLGDRNRRPVLVLSAVRNSPSLTVGPMGCCVPAFQKFAFTPRSREWTSSRCQNDARCCTHVRAPKHYPVPLPDGLRERDSSNQRPWCERRGGISACTHASRLHRAFSSRVLSVAVITFFCAEATCRKHAQMKAAMTMRKIICQIACSTEETSVTPTSAPAVLAIPRGSRFRSRWSSSCVP